MTPPQNPSGTSRPQSGGSGGRRRPNTVAVVVAIVVVVIVLVVIGLIRLAGAFEKSLDGGPESGERVDVTEGAAFTLDGDDYAAGWRFERGGGPDESRAKGLVVTAGSDLGHPPLVTFFIRSEGRLDRVVCRAPGPLDEGESAELACTGDEPPTTPTRITAG